MLQTKAKISVIYHHTSYHLTPFAKDTINTKNRTPQNPEDRQVLVKMWRNGTLAHCWWEYKCSHCGLQYVGS